MKAINCATCRKKILAEARDEYLNYEYAVFRDSSRSFAVFAVCGVLSAMIRRGRTKQYIQRLYSDMCLLFSTPDFFGKKISMIDVMHTLEKEYGIDWSKLEVHIESQKEWIHNTKKGLR